jgi:hypothetical protein
MLNLSSTTLLPVVDLVANQTKKVQFDNLEYSLGVFNTVATNSASWNNGGGTFAIVSSNSAYWNNGYSNLTNITAGHTLLTNTSSKWNSTNTTFVANSTYWQNISIQVENSSPAWNSNYNTTYSNSANWTNTYTNVKENSSAWGASSSISNILQYLSTNTITINNAIVLNSISAADISSITPSSSAVISDNNATQGKGNNTLHVAFKNGVYFSTPILSATNLIYDGNSNSIGWSSVYTTVRQNSASWEEYAEILPTVTNYLSTTNVMLSSLTVMQNLSVAGILSIESFSAPAAKFIIGDLTLTKNLSVVGTSYMSNIIADNTNIILSAATVTNHLSVNGPIYCNDLKSDSLNVALSTVKITDRLTVNNSISTTQFLTDRLRLGTLTQPISVVTFPSTTITTTSAIAAIINGQKFRIPIFI